MEGKTKKVAAVKRHHKSRGRSATPRNATPSCTYDPGRSEMAGCLSGRSFVPRLPPSLVSRRSPVQSRAEKKMLPRFLSAPFEGRSVAVARHPARRASAVGAHLSCEQLEGDTDCHAPRRGGLNHPAVGEWAPFLLFCSPPPCLRV